MPKFTKDQLLAIFGPGNAAKSNKLAIENPELWREMRTQAISEDILAAQPRDKMRAVRQEWDQQARPREFSQEELIARAKWPESKALEFVNTRDCAKLNSDDPLSYARLQLALASYGKGRHTVEQAAARVAELARIPEPVAVQDLYTLTPDMANAVGLKPGERVPLATFNNAIRAVVQLEDERKAAEIYAQATAQIEAENAAKNQ